MKRTPIKRQAKAKRQFNQFVREGWAAGMRDNKFGAVRTVCAAGHHHASKLESAWCAALSLLEKGGAIRGLRQQVQHTLYLQGGKIMNTRAPGIQIYTCMLGWCSCFGKDGRPMPPGFTRIRAIIPDFEFEEKDKLTGEWQIVTADAKGAQQEVQAMAYKLFALLHGREVRLYKGQP